MLSMWSLYRREQHLTITSYVILIIWFPKERGGEPKGSKGRGQPATLPLCHPPPPPTPSMKPWWIRQNSVFLGLFFLCLCFLYLIYFHAHTHNTHALFIYFYTAEIIYEIRKNKFKKPTPIQVYNLHDWIGLCNHLCVNLKKLNICC